MTKRIRANASRDAEMVKRATLEWRVIQTAMFDHRRLCRLGWIETDLEGAPRRHWNACAAYQAHLKDKK